MESIPTNNFHVFSTPEKYITSPKKPKEDPVIQKLRQTIILMIQQKQRVSIFCTKILLTFFLTG